MSIPYCDTSALVKHYLNEVGSAWVRSLLAVGPTPIVFTSRLTVVEVACAFVRRRREGALSPADYARALTAFEYDMAYRYNLIDVDPAIVDTARRLADRHPLRAYDAVQLATAWRVNEALLRAGDPPLAFITADDRLLRVAQAEGLLTDNPHHHT